MACRVTFRKCLHTFTRLCAQVTISKDDTIILDGGGDKSAIGARCDQIRDAMDNASSDYDRYTHVSGP